MEKRIYNIRDSIPSIKEELNIREELRHSLKNYRLNGNNKKDENNIELINRKIQMKKDNSDIVNGIENIKIMNENINNEKKFTNIKDKKIEYKKEISEKKQIKEKIQDNKKENVIQININDNNSQIKENY